jgi:hypothetical protein
MFRSHRAWPMRRMAEPSRRDSNSSRVQEKSSTSVAASRPFLAAKSGTRALRANLFHGQASWQSSQP